VTQTITVALDRNEQGNVDQANGSQGLTTGASLAPGTYTVCEVPVAYLSGHPSISLLVYPRPAYSPAGDTGFDKQQTNDLCIQVTINSGMTTVKFLNKTSQQPTSTPTSTSNRTRTPETGRIAIFKLICDRIGEQDTCNGRDTSLSGYLIDFQVRSGAGATSGPVVQTITVNLSENALGNGDVGNGSQGRMTGASLNPGTYTVCELPTAYRAGHPNVSLLGYPRPTASQGGSSGGENQQQIGDLCIQVTVNSGVAELKFLNITTQQPTVTPTTVPTNTKTPIATPTSTATSTTPTTTVTVTATATVMATSTPITPVIPVCVGCFPPIVPPINPPDCCSRGPIPPSSSVEVAAAIQAPPQPAPAAALALVSAPPPAPADAPEAAPAVAPPPAPEPAAPPVAVQVPGPERLPRTGGAEIPVQGLGLAGTLLTGLGLALHRRRRS